MFTHNLGIYPVYQIIISFHFNSELFVEFNILQICVKFYWDKMLILLNDLFEL